MIKIWEGITVFPAAGEHAPFATFRRCFVPWFLDGLSIIVVIHFTCLSRIRH
jgi:hypothetical protein